MSRPASCVAPTLDMDVLLVLARTTHPLSGRDVSRLVTRGSWSGVRRVLHRLLEQGLVDATETGKVTLFTLNRDHVAAPAVLALASLRAELFERIRGEIRRWGVQPVSASVFGSAARGDGDVDSDVDILLVRPDDIALDQRDWLNQVTELAAAVQRWTGNVASVIEASDSEARSLHDRNQRLAEEVLHDSVPLGGSR